ncbi:MAG: type IV pilus assembly protein PilM [Candidatus Moranbacteria bacterium]|nr:type IV pilus assembly protein PilM [Candidatus Moranbacteria bacterium]
MFGFGENSFLGVDVGTSSIKLAEIEIKDNKPILSNYAWMKNTNSEKDFDQNKFEVVLPEYLKRMVKEAKFGSRRQVFASIPAFGGFITLIECPIMSKEELDKAIKLEAKKYIPTSLDEVVLNWGVLGGKKGGNPADQKSLQVLLVAAPKIKIAKQEKFIQEAGLKLRSIEIESFSLVRSLIGNDPGNFIIIDIGARVCNMVLVEGGEIKVNRNINAGGRNITKEIARNMNIDEERAEKMKISSRNMLESQESKLIFPILDLIIQETKRVILNYYGSEKNVPLNGIIISGGTANFSGLANYLQDKLGLRTIVGNPLGRVAYNSQLEPKLGLIKTQMAVCLGLALKGVEEYFKSK